MSDDVIRPAYDGPTTIYLQWYEYEEGVYEDCIAWCQDKINDSDVEFVTAAQLQAANEQIARLEHGGDQQRPYTNERRCITTLQARLNEALAEREQLNVSSISTVSLNDLRHCELSGVVWGLDFALGVVAADEPEVTEQEA